eukprot:1762293-Amphidinium_carterae.1
MKDMTKVRQPAWILSHNKKKQKKKHKDKSSNSDSFGVSRITAEQQELGEKSMEMLRFRCEETEEAVRALRIQLMDVDHSLAKVNRDATGFELVKNTRVI